MLSGSRWAAVVVVGKTGPGKYAIVCIQSGRMAKFSMQKAPRGHPLLVRGLYSL